MKAILFVCVIALLFSAVYSTEENKEGSSAPAAAGGVEGPVIGIDLGTTYSCVGVWKNGRVEVIPNEQGNRITPSYVAFTEQGERLIGDAAKNQATLNPSNTIYDIKRFIGRRFTDPTVVKDRSLLPFKIFNKESRPYVELTVKEGDKPKQFSPEEISAMVLTKMKVTAEAYLGVPVKNAVVTVPAYFNDAQRQATKDAGVIAGLNVVRIINEPTAAAIAYGLDRTKENKDHKILVFDLGGGTFDVSILTIDNGVFEVLATNGDTHLGGEDFDQRVVEFLIKQIKADKNIDVSNNKRALAKLRRSAEAAKRQLSTDMSTQIDIEGLADGEDFSETLTRAKFEQLNEDLFQKTLKPVELVLKDSGLKKTEINEIVLVGGSTKIPRVQELLTKFFNGKELNKKVNPDEAVAYGAAVQGAILAGQGGASTEDLVLLDVTPLTMGLEVVGGVFLRFIERNSVIPTKKTKILTTEADYQTSVPIKVFQGERPRVKDNVYLGEFTMSGIPPMKKGVPEIEVTFEIDANGILQVHAVDKATKKRGSVTITAETGRLSSDDIARMVEESEKFKDDDSAWQAKMEAKSELENYIYQMRHTFEEQNFAEQMSTEQKTAVTKTLEEAEEWLEASRDDRRKEADYTEKQKEIQSVCDPIITKLYKGAAGPETTEEEEHTHEEL